MLRLLIPLLLLAPAAWACDFPDSERASAPEWLCGEHQYEGAFHTAVGSKTRMPSISLQNRLAGRDAVSGVLRALFTDAVEKLQPQLSDVRLRVPDLDDIGVAKQFVGITVLAKAKSPQRQLFVLAGVPEAERQRLESVAWSLLMLQNRDAIVAARGEAAYEALAAQSQGEGSADAPDGVIE